MKVPPYRGDGVAWSSQVRATGHWATGAQAFLAAGACCLEDRVLLVAAYWRMNLTLCCIRL